MKENINDIRIRNILAADNASLAAIIRQTMEEFGVNHPNTVYYDASTDNLFDLFQVNNARYNVAELNGKIAGGAGIFPTAGLDEDTCELVKMWLKPEARGLGVGRLLIQKCMEQALELGYKKIYLETMPELVSAKKLYEKSGFQYLKTAMGKSGHTGCAVWMLKKLDA